jgi:hypothetical protein
MKDNPVYKIILKLASDNLTPIEMKSLIEDIETRRFTDRDRQLKSKTEIEILDENLVDIYDRGAVSIECPYCGGDIPSVDSPLFNGSIEFVDGQILIEAPCENEDCIHYETPFGFYFEPNSCYLPLLDYNMEI